MLNIAVKAARRAGSIINRAALEGGALEVKAKNKNDFVTQVDKAAEQAILGVIRAAYPDHSVLAEESGDAPGARPEYLWVIDPLDGTTNYIHGFPQYCVSIALEVDGRLEVAVVYDPMADELFTAERGGGARLNGRPLARSGTSALGDALLCTGFPYTIHERRGHQLDVFAAFLSQARAVRRLGSAALDLCYVAAGRFDGFWEEHLHPWDMAAGILIVQEAGGRVSRYDDSPCSLTGGQIVASNGALHDAMLVVIRSADPQGGAESCARTVLAFATARALGILPSVESQSPRSIRNRRSKNGSKR